ncbi:hypothetical protein NUW54_g13460 [Trametes sanguinea]|uniref:Uncharacterized protein n=1 Tax=Trametes sanguinea TaxID=158606 RepID=A0ACC1ML01_9APHY|nr:hypothetical protein NUW54_g13460 [Trametes sanguinea]
MPRRSLRAIVLDDERPEQLTNMVVSDLSDLGVASTSAKAAPIHITLPALHYRYVFIHIASLLVIHAAQVQTLYFMQMIRTVAPWLHQCTGSSNAFGSLSSVQRVVILPTLHAARSNVRRPAARPWASLAGMLEKPDLRSRLATTHKILMVL